jgi:hypothetical protein
MPEDARELALRTMQGRQVLLYGPPAAGLARAQTQVRPGAGG